VHRRVLFLGLLISLLYIVGVVYFNKAKVKSDKFKFLYVLNNKKLTLIAKLPDNNIAKELISKVEAECGDFDCKKDISFDVQSDDKEKLKLLEKLIDFSKNNSLSSASLVAKDDNIELNFLLKSSKEVKNLRRIYKDFNTLNINDKSSVLKVFDVANMQDDINAIIEKNVYLFKDIKLDLKTIRILNKIFRKVKVLGMVEIQFYVNSTKNHDKLKSYILTHYPWVKSIKIQKKLFWSAPRPLARQHFPFSLPTGLTVKSSPWIPCRCTGTWISALPNRPNPNRTAFPTIYWILSIPMSSIMPPVLLMIACQ